MRAAATRWYGVPREGRGWIAPSGDPHLDLARSESLVSVRHRCCECRRPWDGFATFDDGAKLCESCARADEVSG